MMLSPLDPNVRLVIDLAKAKQGEEVSGHKYLRRYRIGETWRYVYEEPEGQGRQELAHEAVEAIKELAEMGNRRARFLVQHTETRTPRSADALDAPLFGNERTYVTDFVKTSIAETLRNVEGAGTGGNAFVQAYQRSGLSYVQLQQEATRGDTLREILESIDKVAKKVDRAMKGLNPQTSASQPVREANGYGNLIFNTTLRRLEASTGNLPGRLPALYSRYHQRGDELTPVATFATTAGRAELERRVERRREEANARAAEARIALLRSYEGTMTHAIAMKTIDPLDAMTLAQLHETLTTMFGPNVRAEDFPYHDFPGTNVKVKIVTVRPSTTGIEFNMRAERPDGTPITTAWGRQWSFTRTPAGKVRPKIYNAILRVDAGQRGSDARVGELVNEAQFKFMKKYAPENGTIGVTAALDVGGYNWCNTGFSFSDPSELVQMRTNFRTFLHSHGIRLDAADMQVFTEPCHFSAFNDGKKYLIQASTDVKLTDKQVETRSLTGKEGEFPLTPAEVQAGRSRRMAVHLGKKFLLGKSWSGTVEAARMNQSNQAWRFYENYRNKREEAWRVLDPDYRQRVERVRDQTTRGGETTITTSAAGTTTTTSATVLPREGEYTLPAPSRERRSRTGARIAQVRRPQAFGGWSYARQRRWANQNRAQMSVTQHRTIQNIIRARAEETMLGRREINAFWPTVTAALRSPPPEGLLSGTVDTATMSDEARNDLIRATQTWHRAFVTAADEGYNAVDQGEVNRRAELKRLARFVVNDFAYRVRYPDWNDDTQAPRAA